MRKFAVTVLALLFLFGCSSQGEESPQVSSPAETVVMETAKDKRAEVVAKANADMEQRLKVIEEEVRERNIAFAKDTITRFRDRSTDWVAVVKSGQTGPLLGLCSQVEKVLDLHRVFGDLDLKSSWAIVGIPRAELWEEFRIASKKAATDLFAIYKIPLDKRDVGCGRGEGQWHFGNPGAVMERLLWIMDGAKLSPETSINTTAEVMRQALINDYRVYIARFRKMIAEGKASKSDAGGTIIMAVHDAKQTWDISSDQLGLTVEEKQMLAER